MNRKSIAYLLIGLLLTAFVFENSPGRLPSLSNAAGADLSSIPEEVLNLDGSVPIHPQLPFGPITGPQKVLVLRVYFADYPATSRYTKSEVEGFFDELDTLWQNTSYGNISIEYEVSNLFQLPDNRSAYIDDSGTPDTCAEDSGGDLSCGGKYLKVLTDAVNNAPNGLDWSDLDDVLVVMAETDSDQFHRGQSLCPCSLPAGPGSDEDMNVDGAIFSENPSETDVQVWGRWAHEIGHAFQQGGPGHPSKYNSEFELMDSNMPGQTGIFEKQADMAYPGWMPEDKYQTFTPSCEVGPASCSGLGGGTASIWAMEYNPMGLPNVQAVKAYITDNLYYLISVRRQVLGDDLNGQYNGIPDEGVLIERVEEQADQWVVIQGKGGFRNDLWDAGDIYTNASDGIQIIVDQMINPDNYLVLVTYDLNAANQPDVMLYPWTSPPGNTWETTDIWIDSPANGYSTYRFGVWNDLDGNLVPKGNGDEPTIGQVNRLYARVRNIGGAPASNVVVKFEITDPPGLGINDVDWASLGQVDASDFPQLATINPGEFVDVYLEWTPNFDIPDDEVKDGMFAFHTCLRVVLDPVSGETVLGNQDGDKEQENVFYFSVPDNGVGEDVYDAVIHLHNDDPFNPQTFYIHKSNEWFPDDWDVEINEGEQNVVVGPNDFVDIPVQIISGSTITYSPGTAFGVDVYASALNLLTSDLDPNDQHPENQILGGVRLESRVERETTLDCIFEELINGGILIYCDLDGIDPYYDPNNPPVIMVEAVARDLDGRPIYLTDSLTLLTVDDQGTASGTLILGLDAPDGKQAVEIFALFSGTEFLSSATTGFYPIGGYKLYLPTAVK